ncbi:MAG: RHS repeat-associated core domain-containing protein [Desulfobacterales bacterium]|nr:RHS repeat-associated core domain-containing protein [Desulfobacterales bacterium]
MDVEKKAAVRTLVHANTPTIAFSDSLGNTFLTVAHNKFERGTNGDTTIIDEKYNTRVVSDIEGNQREVIDARDRIVMRYDYDMLGSPIHQSSMEAGERWMLNNVAGNPIRTWDSRGFQRRMTYDDLQRPVELFVVDTTDTAGVEFLAEKSEYGESKLDPEITNHRLKPWKVHDGAGVVVSDSYDFKGNPLISTRQLLSNYISQVNWAQDPPLETETFTSSTTYDALNRPVQIIAPHSSKVGTKFNITQPVYNEANLLEREDVWLEQNAEPEGLLDPDTATQHFVTNIDYNAKGQRELIEYGNGVRTQYEYDPVTFRLRHMQTLRETRGLQDLFYTYDPVGNITVIRDDAQQTIFFNGQVVKPDADYKYDAIYRLIQSHGREHIGQASQLQATWNDEFRVNLAHPNEGQAMRNYFEFYEYDEVGNILRFDHKANSGSWIRDYEYNEINLIETDKNNNRLSQTIVHPNGQQPVLEPYTHDSHGNMTSMPHLSQMEWDFDDQLHHVEKGNVMAYYVYDAAGERVRKVVEKNGGTLIEERIYLGGFEIFRKHNGSGIVLERETLHIMDDEQRIAMVETRTVGAQDVDRAPRQLLRYQFGNHLGSASLELDDSAQVISYEEYYPYGSTSYQAVRKDIEVPLKRYRYTGKERDDESGLNYHGARYYAPWLGRWTSADPEYYRFPNWSSFAYAFTNPLIFLDETGRAPKGLDVLIGKLDILERHAKKYEKDYSNMLADAAEHGFSDQQIENLQQEYLKRGQDLGKKIKIIEGKIEIIENALDKKDKNRAKVTVARRRAQSVGGDVGDVRRQTTLKPADLPKARVISLPPNPKPARLNFPRAWVVPEGNRPPKRSLLPGGSDKMTKKLLPPSGGRGGGVRGGGGGATGFFLYALGSYLAAESVIALEEEFGGKLSEAEKEIIRIEPFVYIVAGGPVLLRLGRKIEKATQAKNQRLEKERKLNMQHPGREEAKRFVPGGRVMESWWEKLIPF